MLSCNCILAGTVTCQRCSKRKFVESAESNEVHFDYKKPVFTMIFEKETYTGNHDNVYITPKENAK